MEAPTIHDLIQKMVKDPLEFTLSDHNILYRLLKASADNSFAGPDPYRNLLRKTTLRILDLAEDGIFKSTADKGVLGLLNKRSRGVRQKRYKRLIAKDFRRNDHNTVILAEGDSWFEHPLIMDVLDHLEFKEDVAIYSLAYGSDWLDNIIYQGEYIDQISLLKPDIFLVSGGGNDIIQGGKLALFIQNPAHPHPENPCEPIPYEKLLARFPVVAQWGQQNCMTGYKAEEWLPYVRPEFFAFLNIMLFQYYYMFRSIQEKYPEMLFFTQGYDYATPDSKIIRKWYSVFQHALNCIMNSGHWIELAMKQVKVYDPERMHNILRLILGLFNEGLIDIGRNGKIDNLYHIDSRCLTSERDWFDEIHIKDYKYLQIAETYHYAIEQIRNKKKTNQKVFRSEDIWKLTSKPSFGYFMKGFIRTSPTWKVLFWQLVACVAVLGLWWCLFPDSYTCEVCWPQWLRNGLEAISFKARKNGCWQHLANSCKIPFTLFVLGFPLFIYLIRIVRSVWLSWRFWRKSYGA